MGSATLNGDKFSKATRFVRENNPFFALALLFIASAMLSDAFLTGRNITNLLRQYSGMGIISLRKQTKGLVSQRQRESSR